MTRAGNPWFLAILSLAHLLVLASCSAYVPRVRLQGYVALCTLSHNHNKHVREFVRYHVHIGVGRIYLYDLDSALPLFSTVLDYIYMKKLEYIFQADTRPRRARHFYHGAKGAMYLDCLRKSYMRHQWVAFIDMDEFIVLQDRQMSLHKLLHHYSRYGGLAVNWLVLGQMQAGNASEEGGVLLKSTACLPSNHSMNRAVKTIVNPNVVARLGDNARFFRYRDGFFAVNELFRLVAAGESPPSHKSIAIHKYKLRDWKPAHVPSEQEHLQKWQQLKSISEAATAWCTRGFEVAQECCSKP